MKVPYNAIFMNDLKGQIMFAIILRLTILFQLEMYANLR